MLFQSFLITQDPEQEKKIWKTHLEYIHIFTRHINIREVWKCWPEKKTMDPCNYKPLCLFSTCYNWVQFEWPRSKMLLQQDWLESAGKCCDWVCSGTDQLYWRLVPVNGMNFIHLPYNKYESPARKFVC